MGHYPVISLELTRRKWGLARSQQRLERTSKSLMIQSDQEFKLIGQVFREQEERINDTNLKVTSDGSRTICTSSGKGYMPIITISQNYPTIDNESKESKNVRYSLQGEIGGSKRLYIMDDFVFNNNEREILYCTDHGLFCLDLETGKITEGPGGNYNQRLFQFHRNTIITSKGQTLKRISLNNITTTKGPNTRIQCQDLCVLQGEPIPDDCRPYELDMDVNPVDYSTVASVGKNNRLYLHDMRKFHTCGNSMVKPIGEEPMFSLKIPFYPSGRIKFSPSGSKIAVHVVCNYRFDSRSFIIVYNVNDANDLCHELVRCPVEYGPFYWYDEENLCFFKSDMIVSWNINTQTMCQLFPAFELGVYVHPELPLIANYAENLFPTTKPVFKLWSY